MIDALIAGTLHAKPEERTGKNGKPFATARVRAATGDETIFVNVIAFNASAVSSLLALGPGDSVALAGRATPKVWTDREGTAHAALDLVAAAVLTAYHVARKRKAVQHDDEAQAPQARPADGVLADDGLPDF